MTRRPEEAEGRAQGNRIQSDGVSASHQLIEGVQFPGQDFLKEVAALNQPRLAAADNTSAGEPFKGSRNGEGGNLERVGHRTRDGDVSRDSADGRVQRIKAAERINDLGEHARRGS